MFNGKLRFYLNYLKGLIACYFILWFSSCSVIPKNYPKKKPFVYEYNINIEGNLSAQEKTTLKDELINQLDDSIRVRTARKIFYQGINRPVLNNPPLYDQANAEKSISYMKALLKSQGYFKSTIQFDTKIDTVKNDQYRTFITFNVNPGKPVMLDSISYNIQQQDLLQLTNLNKKESLLKKGVPFAKTNISLELDRLVDLYRNNGYLKFNKDMLQGLWDTLDITLLQPNLDFFEQIEMLEKLKAQRINPTADLEIRLRPGIDFSRLKKYYVGNITLYPDFSQDTTGYNLRKTSLKGIDILYYRNMFKPSIFPPYISLKRGDEYSQKNYFKTLNRLNSLGAWRLVNIEQIPRKEIDTADFIIRLTPARKYTLTANLEGSLNQSAVSGNLAGFSFNIGLQNKNIFKAADQSNTNIRFGIETGRDTVTNVKFVQTKQLSFSQTIYFPRIILVNNLVPKKMRENARTILSFNAATTERRALFNLSTINGSWGYEFQWPKSSLFLRFPNIEYSILNRKPLLDSLFKDNPSLKYIFTDGFISSSIGNFTRTGGRNKNINIFRSNMEVSGIVSGLISKNNFLDKNLYRFIKLDAEFVRKIVYNKSALVLRLFAGVGYEFNSTVNPDKKNNLPFFKQYFAGGPNSMRAWALRKLGPGSISNDFSLNPERYGDMQLESNIEYRFPIRTISGVIVNGALFSDIGNVWFLKKAVDRPNEEVFNVSRLGKDIAIGAGAGLRIDFSFFVVRFDFSYKVKDPSPELRYKEFQNKWFGWNFSKGTQFQLGISYPFIL